MGPDLEGCKSLIYFLNKINFILFFAIAPPSTFFLALG
jgi:hypothetical protein